MLRNTLRRNKGITLIALVVTIIVLLILAGISIMMLTGQNGILNRAGEAKEVTGTSQTEERVKLAYNYAVVAQYTEDNPEFINVMTKELEKTYGEGKVSITEKDGLYTVIIDGKEYTVGGSTQTEENENEEVATATFNDGVTLTWEELKDTSNGKKYGYDALKITDTAVEKKAFYYCVSLASIKLPNNVETIREQCFRGM